MASLGNVKQSYYTKRYWGVAIILISVIVVSSIPWRATDQRVVTAYSAPPLDSQGAIAQQADQNAHVISTQGIPASTHLANTGFAPFLDIVPSSDGSNLFISAGGSGELDDVLFANVGIGPGSRKKSYTMTYSDTVDVYVTTAMGLDPLVGLSGTIDITSTQGLETETVAFQRAYVPYDPDAALTEVVSEDGNLRLRWADPDTLPIDAYIVIVPSYAPPADPPPGHRLVSSSYSIRADGARLTSDKPMLLTMRYDERLLQGETIHNLALFGWVPEEERWEQLASELSSDTISATTSRFTTYALMAMPAWRDHFNDQRGLDPQSDIQIDAFAGTAVLSSTQRSGVALSLPITSTATITRWGTLTYQGDQAPPDTTLRIDVLSTDGTPLLTDVANNTDLASIDPAEHQGIRLRARLEAQETGTTPSLDMWQVSWEVVTESPSPTQQRIYLPQITH